MSKRLIILFSMMFSVIGMASDNYFCNSSYESLPTLHAGRVKPLIVAAKESFRFINGKEKIEGYDPVMAYCLFSLNGLGLDSPLKKIDIKVDHVKAKEFLGMAPGQSHIPSDVLAGKMDSIKQELMKLKLNDAYKKELNRVFGRYSEFQALSNAELWMLYDKKADFEFLPLHQFLTEEKVKLVTDQSASPFEILLKKSQSEYIKDKSDKYLTELTLDKVSPFTWSILLVILALSVGVLVQSRWPVVAVALLGIGLEVVGMYWRVVISGRAPITNMYETVMFSGFGALVISLLITIYRREKLFVMAGLSYNMLTLLMMKFANNMLDPSISPLVPVLRDNFWLSTHVTTIILSYAALALSWILANIILVKQLVSYVDKQELKQKTELVYTCLKFGIVLLSAGIILGGVWADYSWGRFWGWDPKETWSLIVLLVYMAILHGKYTNWITNDRFIPMVAGAFMTVMMAWFGVNYILASGLHSYGFSEGGAVFLGIFFLVQVSILVLSFLRTKKMVSTQN